MGRVWKRSNRTGGLLRNYSLRYKGADGRSITVSSGTSDKRAAERILVQKEAEVALVNAGAVDPDIERFRLEAAKPIGVHLKDYLAACVDIGQAAHGLKQKERHLDWLLDATGALVLADLRPDDVDRLLGCITERGRAARTVNLKIEAANAFLNWCVRNSRLRSNPLRIIERRNELLGVKRLRRALSSDECKSLLAVARGRGRALWYLLPLRAGLRRGDMERLTWGAVDLEAHVLTIRGGKARHRVDRLPLCPELLSELRRVRPSTVLPSARVFPRGVSNNTRRKDFTEAKILLVNDREEHADLHSLRVTFGTDLALMGVPPAVLQKLMRHCTVELTMKYYTKLSLEDLNQRGVDLLPSLEAR